ncbi:hypothetical protein [Dysgonomonas sp. HGC4]|uniref:hypothetical protein n=1 Tax=Dysgonomonas sp. HGC4 TaxID=1658009 RepID=UPI00067FDE01|nr:hypothetical protein [Dysgonomonas sp. HGC4]MBD8347509.1 hypothetical protein [Dysgonomonas sp. HGC4]
MKSKYTSLLRFETIIIIFILVAFSLTWISWGKLIVTGWDLPSLYKKTTKISNTIMFFSKKDSPHLAYVFYIVPLLGLLSATFLFKIKYRTANFILLFTSALGIFVSLYMYVYFISSKMFKLKNAGGGIHLLLFVSIIGLIWSFIYCSRKKKGVSENISPETIGEPDSLLSEKEIN